MEIKYNSPKKPENSGASAQVLASLRAEKLRRTPSTIIKHLRATKALANALRSLPRAGKLRLTIRNPSTIIKRLRAAKALAASRMAAQVALDKLEARAAGLAEDRAVSLHAADLLDHARDQGSTLERALEDFQGEAELLGEMGDLVLSRAYDIDAEVA